jgi:hypothetical protein
MNGHAHLLLGMVVVGADLEVIQEGQQFMAVAAQALDKPLGIPVRPGCGDELIEPSMELRLAPFIALGRELPAPLSEPDGIAQQTSEFFAEAPPRGACGALIDLEELGKEMEITLLLSEGIEGVVCVFRTILTADSG